MNMAAEAWAETQRQLAFVSALVGGGAFAFVGSLLTIQSRSRITGWTIGLSMLAAAGMLVCTLGWSMAAGGITQVAVHASESGAFEVPERFMSYHNRLSMYFVPSILFFLASLGLSGWIRSRAMGIFSTFVALLAVISCGRIILPFME